MDAIPIPKEYDAGFQYETVVFMPPDGDMTNDKIRAAEGMVTAGEDGFPRIVFLIRVNEEEIEEIKKDGTFMLCFLGNTVIPFSLFTRSAQNP